MGTWPDQSFERLEGRLFAVNVHLLQPLPTSFNPLTTCHAVQDIIAIRILMDAPPQTHVNVPSSV